MKAVLGLGANLRDRAAALQTAVDGLAAETRIVAVSAIFETTPMGGPPQPDYYNAVVVVDTDRSPAELLALAHRLEAAAARVRLERWGPRTLDVDVLAYEGVRSDDPDLRLPHPRAHERAFVLLPWLDADAGAQIEGFGPVAELVRTVDTSGVRRLTEPSLQVRARDRVQGP
jgi:dihydroneopterin aldolase/2-amino-4-hydroxy-6-hydroxymethyldihydropteridine diphosphokinase